MLVRDNTSIRCEQGVRGRQVKGHRGHNDVCAQSGRSGVCTCCQ